MKSGLSALAILAAGILFGLSAYSTELMTAVFLRTSYFIVLLLSLTALYAWSKVLGKSGFSLTTFLKQSRVGLMTSLVLTVLVFLSVPIQFKTLSDETNLLSVSQSMTFDKSIGLTTMGKFYYGNFNPINVEVPLRPLLFPFFTSVIHSITGYRPENVFVLNFLTLFALLTGVFLVVEKTRGRKLAFAALFLVLSYPIFSITATSGGFDLLSSTFIFFTLVVLYRFLHKESLKESGEIFNLLWMMLLMCAHIRYESLIFLPIVVTGLLFWKKISLKHFLNHKLFFSLTFLFLYPLLIQRVFNVGHFENPSGVELFSGAHFWNHFIGFLRHQIDFRYFLPFNVILNLISFASIIALVFFARGKILNQLGLKRFVILTSLILLIGTAIFFSFHFGVYEHPTQARFFLNLSLVLALIPVFTTPFFPNIFKESSVLGIAIVFFILFHPIATQNRFIQQLILNRETAESYKFLDALHNPGLLIIHDRPGQYTVRNEGAVNFSYANENKENLLQELKRHLFSEIIVFQKIRYDNGKPLIENELDPFLKLETLKEFQSTDIEFTRISRVVSR